MASEKIGHWFLGTTSGWGMGFSSLLELEHLGVVPSTWNPLQTSHGSRVGHRAASRRAASRLAARGEQGLHLRHEALLQVTEGRSTRRVRRGLHLHRWPPHDRSVRVLDEPGWLCQRSMLRYGG